MFYQSPRRPIRRQSKSIPVASRINRMHRWQSTACFAVATLIPCAEAKFSFAENPSRTPVKAEPVSGEGIWIDPRIKRAGLSNNSKATRSGTEQKITVKVWFDRQVLGTGDAYQRRAMEFATSSRRELRRNMVETLPTDIFKKADKWGTC